MPGHVGCESWLERDHLRLLDYDPVVVAIASAAVGLYWTTAKGKGRSHAPDYYVRHVDGSELVVDCQPHDRIQPRETAAFAVTERVCEVLRWHYRRVAARDAVGTAKVLVGRLPGTPATSGPRSPLPCGGCVRFADGS